MMKQISYEDITDLIDQEIATSESITLKRLCVGYKSTNKYVMQHINPMLVPNVKALCRLMFEIGMEKGIEEAWKWNKLAETQNREEREEMALKCKEMHDNGKSFLEIGRELNLTKGIVQGLLRTADRMQKQEG